MYNVKIILDEKFQSILYIWKKTVDLKKLCILNDFVAIFSLYKDVADKVCRLEIFQNQLLNTLRQYYLEYWYWQISFWNYSIYKSANAQSTSVMFQVNKVAVYLECFKFKGDCRLNAYRTLVNAPKVHYTIFIIGFYIIWGSNLWPVH